MKLHLNGTNRRGFAATVAIVLIGVVGLALTMLTTLVAAEARRVRVEKEAAQVRQLLIAGEMLARQGQTNAVVPGAIEGGKIGIGTVEKGSDRVVLKIEATVGKSRGEQTLTMVKQGNGWR